MSHTTYLRRRAAAEYLREQRGIPLSEKTMAKLACVGGGPLTVYSAGSRSIRVLTSTPTPTPSSASRCVRPPNTRTKNEPG